MEVWTFERVLVLHIVYDALAHIHRDRRRDLLVEIFPAVSHLTPKGCYDQHQPRFNPRAKKSRHWPSVDHSQSGLPYTQQELDRFSFFMELVKLAAASLNITLTWAAPVAPFVGGNAHNYRINQAERDAANQIGSALANNPLAVVPAVAASAPAPTLQMQPNATAHGSALASQNNTTSAHKSTPRKRKANQATKPAKKRRVSFANFENEDEEEVDRLSSENDDDFDDEFTLAVPKKNQRKVRKPASRRRDRVNIRRHVKAGENDGAIAGENGEAVPEQEASESGDSRYPAASGGKVSFENGRTLGPRLWNLAPTWRQAQNMSEPIGDDEEDDEETVANADARDQYEANHESETQLDPTFADIEDRLYTDVDNQTQQNNPYNYAASTATTFGQWVTPFDQEWFAQPVNDSLGFNDTNDNNDNAVTAGTSGATGDSVYETANMEEDDDESLYRESEAKVLLDGLLGIYTDKSPHVFDF